MGLAGLPTWLEKNRVALERLIKYKYALKWRAYALDGSGLARELDLFPGELANGGELGEMVASCWRAVDGPMRLRVYGPDEKGEGEKEIAKILLYEHPDDVLRARPGRPSSRHDDPDDDDPADAIERVLSGRGMEKITQILALWREAKIEDQKMQAQIIGSSVEQAVERAMMRLASEE